MSLSSLQLDAFAAVARHGSFSLAAKKLHLTQSALSQRVLNLEAELGSGLFLRETAGVRLTELGRKLLRYCETRASMEAEFLHPASGTSLRGLVKVGAFSSISRSVVLPVLAAFAKENPELKVDLRNKEMRELPPLLSSGAVDLIFLNQPWEKQGLENLLLGHEVNVLVQSSRGGREDIYLDHDEEDPTTHDFFRLQGRNPPPPGRSYLDEIYSVLDGVKLGLGRTVVPLHLAEGQPGLEIVKGYKPMKVPVYLTYYAQAFYTDLQKALLARIKKEVPPRLR